MKIKNFACLLIDNTRSRAYLHKLLTHNLIPDEIIYLRLKKAAKKREGKAGLSGLKKAIQDVYHNRKYFLYTASENAINPVIGKRPELYRSFNPEETIEATLKKHKNR